MRIRFSRTFDDVSLVPSAGDQESRGKTALRQQLAGQDHQKCGRAENQFRTRRRLAPQDCCEPTPHRGDGGTNAPEQGYVPDRVTCRI